MMWLGHGATTDSEPIRRSRADVRKRPHQRGPGDGPRSHTRPAAALGLDME